MNEKKPRLSMVGAIVILSIAIVYSAFVISAAIREASGNNVNHGQYQLQLERFNSNFEEYLRIMESDINN